MALIELVDYNEVYGKEAESAEKKTTRRGRTKAKKAEVVAEEAPAIEEAAPEAPAAEAKSEDKGE
jgi:large subunit ribosomal protein L17